jgi:hypothetical protein
MGCRSFAEFLRRSLVVMNEALLVSEYTSEASLAIVDGSYFAYSLVKQHVDRNDDKARDDADTSFNVSLFPHTESDLDKAARIFAEKFAKKLQRYCHAHPIRCLAKKNKN